MKNIIVDKFEEEIERLLERLSNLEPYSSEYVGITETINKLYVMLNKESELMLNERKLNAEVDKSEKDYDVRTKQLDVEIEKDLNALKNNREQRDLQQLDNLADRDLQSKTLTDSKIWNVAKTSVEIAGIVIPIVFYGVWMKRGLKFEEEGCFTSATFKGLIGKFKPTN